MPRPRRRSSSSTCPRIPGLRRALTGALAAAATSAVLGACSTGTVPDPDSPGALVFAANCTRCHGTDLRGGVGADLLGSPLTEARVRTAIKDGPGTMPSLDERLTEDEKDDVVSYILRLNADPPE